MKDEAVTQATATLFSNGQRDQIAIPRPLRSLLAWRKREDLMVILENEDTLRIVSLTRHMRDIIEADRRVRAREVETVTK